MSEDERVVRAAWDKVRVERDFGFHIWFSGRNDLYLFVEEQNSYPIAWSAARRFTDDHAEKIRQKREDITLVDEQCTPMQCFTKVSSVNFHESFVEEVRNAVRWHRILAGLEADLDEMLKGWRQ